MSVYTVYLNQGTLSASSRSNIFCSSVNSSTPVSCDNVSRRAFSLRHHVVMNNVKKKAMLQSSQL